MGLSLSIRGHPLWPIITEFRAIDITDSDMPRISDARGSGLNL